MVLFCHCGSGINPPEIEIGHDDYDRPTGLITPDAFPAIWDQVFAANIYSKFIPALGFLEEAAFGPLREIEGDIAGAWFNNARIDIDYICEGNKDNPDQATMDTGTLEMTALLQGELSRGTAFGYAQKCVFWTGDRLGEIDGPLTLQQRSDSFLIGVKSNLSFGDIDVPTLHGTARFDITFRLFADRFEQLLQIEDKTYIFYRTFGEMPEGDVVGIRDQKNDWECNFSTLTCFDESGARMSVPVEVSE